MFRRLTLLLILAAPAAVALDAYDAVKPRIGARQSANGVSRNGNTFYDATAPFGMLQVGPDAQTATIGSFPGFHLCNVSGPGVPMGGGCKLLPVAAAAEAIRPTSAAFTLLSTHPGRLNATVTYGGTTLTCEVAARPRHALIRLSRPSPGPITLYGVSADSAATTTQMTGSAIFGGNGGGTAWFGLRPTVAATAIGTGSMTWTNVTEVVIAVAISSNDTAGALGNLPASIPAFATEAAAARQAWVDELSAITLDQATADDLKVKFYTALYHTLVHPSRYSDADGRYRAYATTATKTAPAGTDHYTHFSGWDTYRVHAPLLALLKPRLASDIAASIVRDGRDKGTQVPKWKLWAGEANWMAGNPCAVIAAWTWMLTGGDFAISDADWTVLANRSNRSGVVMNPAAESEHGAANFTLKLLAQRLGRTADISSQDTLSQRWWQLYGAPSGFTAGVWPHNADGTWKTSGFSTGYGDSTNFEESDWDDGQWLFPYDLAKLVALHGGPAAARSRLTTYFSTWSQYNSSTVTTYTMYNQPVHHIPWLAGQIGGMQEQAVRIKALVASDFRTTETSDALPGNDDLGGTSAWLVWSTAGLYPLWPGVGAVAINTPQVAQTVFRFGGKTLTVTRSGTGDYIQGVTLNGVAQTQTWLSLSKLLENPSNTLVIQVGTTATYGLSATAPDWRSITPGGNAKPSISAIASRQVAVGASSGPLGFEVVDLESRSNTLTVTVSSSNPTVVPLAAITLAGTGLSRTVAVTPAAAGSATITLTVSDGSGQATSAFTITTAGNAGPVIAVGATASPATLTLP
jgi:putative alpha-1,2-mannosidase